MAAGLSFPTLSRGLFAYSIPGSAACEDNAANTHAEIAAYTDEALFEEFGIRIAFTERIGGFSKAPFYSLNTKRDLGDSEDCVACNQAAILNAFTHNNAGIPLLIPSQVHGIDVYEVDAASPFDPLVAQKELQAGYDSLSIARPMVAGLLSFADCLPLILVEPGGCFSIVHCGWRGTVAHLAAIALEKLMRMSGCSANQVNAYIGAYIHAECFNVESSVAAQFEREFGSGVALDTHGTFQVDLGAAVERDLLGLGIDKKRIANVGICSSCNTNQFFSYRAEMGTTGRHAAFCVNLSSSECV